MGAMRTIRASLAVVAPAALICVMAFSDPLLAARLELRARDTAAPSASALVGDIIDVDIWVDSESATLSGAAVFLSFDGDVFELVDQDQDPVVEGFQPFAPGGFFNNGEIFRNALLAEDDPAAAPSGEQLDYSVVRATDSGSGPAATFQLRALAPAAGSVIRIDESGIRETRYFQPDGSHASFRFITPLVVDVRGISIEGLPSQIVLARGTVDSTSFALDNMLFDPMYGPSDISWHVEAPSTVDVHIDPETRHLIIVAPPDRSFWEQLILRAINPDGQTTSASVDLFVNAGPVLSAPSDTLDLSEDGTERLSLDLIAEDPDTPDAQLEWTLFAPAELGARIEGPPHELVLEPQADWHGIGQVTLVAADRFGFADSTDMLVHVWSINDAPRVVYSPNLRVTRGKMDSSLALAALFQDVDDDPADLEVSWVGATHTGLDHRHGQLIVTAPDDWMGVETIQLSVTDNAGAVATTTLSIDVVASLAPAVTNAPRRLGVASGQATILDLKDFVTDPDDAATDLLWSVSGQTELLIQVSSTGAVRIEAPAGYAGTETIRFLAADPSGESTSFDVLIFGAPAGGEPLLAPLPTVSLPPGGVNATIDLDEYVFDLDHEPEQISWSASGPTGLELRVDSDSHVLTVLAADSLAGFYDIDLRAVDPDGHETVASLHVQVTSTPVVPVDPVNPAPVTVLALLPLPTLHMTSGGFDQSLVLDGYVQTGDPASVRWEAISSDHVQVLVDNASRRVTVLAEDGWTGPALITIRALDSANEIVAEAFLGVQVDAAAASFALQDLTEVPILQGDSLLTIDPASLLASGPDPLSLTWEASGGYELTWLEGSLQLHRAFADAGDELITVIARDDAGNQASGQLLVRVLATDGTAGQVRDGFRVTVVPNPVHPAFLDLFVLSDDGVAPRLRSNAGTWTDLSLTPLTDGIWHAPHALAAGHDGAVSFLALSLIEGQLHRAERLIHIGTAPMAAGKTLSGGQFALTMEAGTFIADNTMVAIIPETARPADELEPVGSTYYIHATAELQSTPRLTLHSSDPAARAYRWSPSEERWQYIGGDTAAGSVSFELDRFGRYGLRVDRTAPALVATSDGGIQVTDGGAGIHAIEVSAGGVLLPDGLYQDENGIYRVSAAAAQYGQLDVRAADRAGNVATLRLTQSTNALPVALQLGQNYPNPFNPETTIPLHVTAHSGTVRLDIYNTAGQHIRTLVDGVLSPGAQSVVWDGRDASGRAVSSGNYLYRATTGEGVFTRRMTLLR